MSSISVRDAAARGDGQPRVREQARDAAALMVFSLAVSGSVAVGLLLLAHLGR